MKTSQTLRKALDFFFPARTCPKHWRVEFIGGNFWRKAYLLLESLILLLSFSLSEVQIYRLSYFVLKLLRDCVFIEERPFEEAEPLQDSAETFANQTFAKPNLRIKSKLFITSRIADSFDWLVSHCFLINK